MNKRQEMAINNIPAINEPVLNFFSINSIFTFLMLFVIILNLIVNNKSTSRQVNTHPVDPIIVNCQL